MGISNGKGLASLILLRMSCFWSIFFFFWSFFFFFFFFAFFLGPHLWHMGVPRLGV